MSEAKTSQFDKGSFSDKLYDICVRQNKGFMRKEGCQITWVILEGEYYGTYTLMRHNGYKLRWSPHLTSPYKKGNLAEHQDRICKEQNDIKGNCLWNIAGRPEGFIKEEFAKWTMWMPKTLRERKQVCKLILTTRSAKKAMKIWAKKKWKGGELLNWDMLTICPSEDCMEGWLNRLKNIPAPYKVAQRTWSTFDYTPEKEVAMNYYSYAHYEDTVLRDTIQLLFGANSENLNLLRVGEEPYDHMWVTQRVERISQFIGVKELKTWHDRAMRAKNETRARNRALFERMQEEGNKGSKERKEKLLAEREENFKLFNNLPDGARLLRTEEEYITEGRSMGHCVGGYYHYSPAIILALDIDGKRSTAELNVDDKKVIQHRGVDNKECSQAHKNLVLNILSSLG